MPAGLGLTQNASDPIVAHPSVIVPRQIAEASVADKKKLEEAHKKLEAKNTQVLKEQATAEAQVFEAQLPPGVRVKSFLETDGVIAPDRFNPFEQLEDDDFVGFYGTRREGKSWLARYFLFARRHRFRCGEVFTTTKQNHYWQVRYA